MSTINALTFAKARPTAWKRNDREVDSYLTILERLLQQVQTQIGSTVGSVDLGAIAEDAFISGVNYAAGFGHRPVEVISATHTTAYAATLIVSSSITVTLNTTPDDLERVSVQHYASSGQVTVSGIINDQPEIILNNKGDTLDLIYSAELERWVTI